MRKKMAWLLASAAVLGMSIVTAEARPSRKRTKSKRQMIVLDGIPERVNWNDGDSFRVTKGPRKDQKARLKGYNTLESYGPVHFWGGFNGWDLYRTHKNATKLAKSKEWECESDGEADGYGRLLVDCPGLRKALIREGLAHVYAYGDEVPDPELLALQMQAQNNRKGMWKKGIPKAIVTSVHSIDEKTDDGLQRTDSYNRLCDTATGKTYTFKHKKVFKPCDAFCQDGSCMLYLPFEVRYGEKKPACVKGEGKRNQQRAPAHLNEPAFEEREF